MRRSRLLIAVSAVSATLLMLVATVGPASASFQGGRWPWVFGPNQVSLIIPYENEAYGFPEYGKAFDDAAANWTRQPIPLWLHPAAVGACGFTLFAGSGTICPPVLGIVTKTYSDTVDSRGGYEQTWILDGDCSGLTLALGLCSIKGLPPILPGLDVDAIVPVHVPGSRFGPEWSYYFATVKMNRAKLDNIALTPVGAGTLRDVTRLYTATHEFGHALGLRHVPNKACDSVMYPYYDSFVWAHPQPHDVSNLLQLYPGWTPNPSAAYAAANPRSTCPDFAP